MDVYDEILQVLRSSKGVDIARVGTPRYVPGDGLTQLHVGIDLVPKSIVPYTLSLLQATLDDLLEPLSSKHAVAFAQPFIRGESLLSVGFVVFREPAGERTLETTERVQFFSDPVVAAAYPIAKITHSVQTQPVTLDTQVALYPSRQLWRYAQELFAEQRTPSRYFLPADALDTTAAFLIQ